jgi:2-oxoglutarate dehydrogenase E2 component (dihydrolipoamide succinyltransferase)
MIEVKVPVLPESISEATVAVWHKKPGDFVELDDVIVEIETDKVVLEVPAEDSGVLTEIRAKEGETVGEQQVLGILEKKPQERYKDAQERSINAEDRETANFFRRESIRKARKEKLFVPQARKEKEAQKASRVGFRPGSEKKSKYEEEPARIQAEKKEEDENKWAYWIFIGVIFIFAVRQFFF